MQTSISRPVQRFPWPFLVASAKATPDNEPVPVGGPIVRANAEQRVGYIALTPAVTSESHEAYQS